MALTEEIIRANESLKELSDEQINAIATLSQNSEDELFRGKMSEHYRRLDASIEEHSGVKRNGDEKTYDYLPRAIDAMKVAYEESITKLNGEIDTLKADIAKGGDAALKSKVDSLSKELETARGEYEALKESAANDKLGYEKSLNDFKINSEIMRGFEGIEFKASINSDLLSTIKEKAISNIMGKNPAFEEKDGEQRLVFHEGDKPLLNRENKLLPYTAKELLLEEFKKYDILNEKPVKGAGGKGNPPSGGSSIVASSQTEAMTKIESMVTEKGFKKGSTDYQAEVNRLWVENKCSSLPMK